MEGNGDGNSRKSRKRETVNGGETISTTTILHAGLAKCVCLSIEENVDSELCNMAREEEETTRNRGMYLFVLIKCTERRLLKLLKVLG